MTQLRASIRRHHRLAIVLLVLAFFIKAAVPAGMMISSTPDKVLTVTVCTGSAGEVETIALAVPVNAEKGAGHPSDTVKADHCAFTGLSQAALGGADPVLLAAAFAFILVLGLAPVRAAPLARFRYLLPPLRGPPAAA
ncbi:DUF2946 family protein [Altererythrobacter sp. C41]|uniref:DUF2946 family protein n=1 Tax=Altererythrobacter sp. C41 TaxID=2806021 RepID=UPI001933332B|nr:DUF2946 family protein [Altererythrobacter sp. C41]MBM0170562.1 hypothetical protein [Altererythrobacter sp. C41]